MWIKMLTDQVGPDGIFLKGQTLSLPQKMVEKLDSDSYVRVEVDDRVMEQMGVEEKLQHLGAELVTIDNAVKSTKGRLADLHQRRKVLRTKIKQADDELDQIKQARAKTETEVKDGEPQASEPAENERQDDKAADEQGDRAVS